MMSYEVAANTDKEIWRRVPGDYYSPSIHVTEHGDIGINVGGHVLVASIEKWHEAGVKAFTIPNTNKRPYPPGARYGLIKKKNLIKRPRDAYR